jgi:hypothetical protein
LMSQLAAKSATAPKARDVILNLRGIGVCGGSCVTPNAELTGRRRLDALPARCSIDSRRLAGKVASRWRSG